MASSGSPPAPYAAHAAETRDVLKHFNVTEEKGLTTAQVEAARRSGAAVCEIHTGPWAHAVHAAGDRCDAPEALAELAKVRAAGEAIRACGMQFNAGHALNCANVGPIAALPGVHELHIGHSIVADAVFRGMRGAVARMRACIDAAR